MTFSFESESNTESTTFYLKTNPSFTYSKVKAEYTRTKDPIKEDFYLLATICWLQIKYSIFWSKSTWYPYLSQEGLQLVPVYLPRHRQHLRIHHLC